MSENSNATDKKLKQAIEARMAVESARKYQVDTLSNLTSKLSLSCKGLDTELDNRLAKFRNSLNKGVGFEILSPLIDDILLILQNQEALQIAHQRELFSSVQNAGKLYKKQKAYLMTPVVL
ncbi:hypothetical protein ACOBV9_21105 (plasmid) [Pseudoalteromonas espejiana]